MSNQLSDSESDFAGFSDQEENLNTLNRSTSSEDDIEDEEEQQYQLQQQCNDDLRNSDSNPDASSHSSKESHKINVCLVGKRYKLHDRHSSSSSSDLPVTSTTHTNNEDNESERFVNYAKPTKNTLQSDTFRRQLEAITSLNPQLTLKEKVLSWQCATEMSEIEDVNNFDEVFEKVELERETCESTSLKDFKHFRHNMIENMKKQLCKNLCESKIENEKPTTSAAAANSVRRKRLRGGEMKQIRAERWSTYRLNTPTTTITTSNENLKQDEHIIGDNLVVPFKPFRHESQSNSSTSSASKVDCEMKSYVDSPQTTYDHSCMSGRRLPPGGLIQLHLDFRDDKQKMFLRENQIKLFDTKCTDADVDDGKSFSEKSSRSSLRREQDELNDDVGQLPSLTEIRESMKGQGPKMEFYSYLGLRDAPVQVKKPAEIHTMRRSLRAKYMVKREKKLENLKRKQLVSLKSNEESLAQIELDNIMQKYALENEKLNGNNSNVKLLCRMPSKSNKDDIEMPSPNRIKQLPSPVHHNVIQHIKKLPDVNSIIHVNNAYYAADKPSCSQAKKVYNLSHDDSMGIKIIHQRVQKCLESSRQSKPSIFIVQSLSRGEEFKKEKQPQQQVIASDRKSNNENVKEILIDKKDTAVVKKKENKFIGKTRKANIHRILVRSTFKQRQLRSNHNSLIKSLRSNIRRKVKEKQKVFTNSIRKRMRPAATLRLSRFKPKKHTNRNKSNTISTDLMPNLNEKNAQKVLNMQQQENESTTTNPFPTSKINSDANNTCNSIKCHSMKSRHSIRNNGGNNNNINNNNNNNVIKYLLPPSVHLRNPLNVNNGEIFYIYYENDILICVQELVISFWKSTKLINVLSTTMRSAFKNETKDEESTIYSFMNGTSPMPTTMDTLKEWTQLGQTKRFNNDIEIAVPYANRICLNNSTPAYIELRCRYLPQNVRDCNLLSMFIHVYFFNEEEMRARMYAIQLDTVQSSPNNLVFTTIIESRYFIMCWPQENITGKTLTGLCKYSLTPQMDTLASIRPFKSMRHKIRYVDCLEDDKLIGFGDTQVTIWDHRSGDILMNYDIEIQLGVNIGTIFYPSLEFGQNNMILLFQHIKPENKNNKSEIMILACNISHLIPSHRVLQQQQLPLQFNEIKNSVKTNEHIIATAENNDEIWISRTDPDMITFINSNDMRRFYMRGGNQLIISTDKTLTADTFSNHILKLAAGNINY